MTWSDDPRRLEAKRIPITEVADRLGISGLRPVGDELMGPCPLCGGRDRFAINLRTHLFLCRGCNITGFDQVSLVSAVQKVDFKAALAWLCGDRPASVEPKQRERLRAEARATAQRRTDQSERYRQRTIADARAIWRRARPGTQGIVRAYLRARGFTPDLLPDLPGDLRFILDHPYVKKLDGRLETLHRGPCMIAPVRRPNGDLSAVHQTWVSRDPPHGKARILHLGEMISAKLVRGSKKGGAIRLFTPERYDTLVMAEGIETTLTAAVSWGAQLDPARTAYWAGVDLGNMAGRMQRIEGVKHSGLPDMSDLTAFVPPSWLRRLIFIMDGDSDPRMTRAKLLSGLRRAMAVNPNLQCQLVPAPAGVDLNDVLTGKSLHIPTPALTP